MKESFKLGISFGLTSGIITTLALMIGLETGTGLKLAVIGGVLTVAIADAFSDALGIHISEESNEKNTHAHVWEATIATFLTKFIISSSFLIPFIFFDMFKATVASIIWGFSLMIIFNYRLAKSRKEDPKKMIFEHVFIAVIVITISYYVGKLVSMFVK